MSEIGHIVCLSLCLTHSGDPNGSNEFKKPLEV